MKRVFIIHCWEGYPEYCWYPKIKQDLEAQGPTVNVLKMPHPDRPSQADWVNYLSEAVGTPDSETYLVGHSVGAITILRYLEGLKQNIKVGGVVMVAGFVDGLSYMDSVEDKTVLPSFFKTPIDFDKIKTRAKKFVAIHSDNDPYVELKHGEALRDKLGAELIVKPGMKHFSGPIENDENCTDLPEVTAAILKMVN